MYEDKISSIGRSRPIQGVVRPLWLSKAICACSVVVIQLFVGCERDPARDVSAPDSLILYSIDGRYFKAGTEPKTGETFHGYPVLGKVEVTDPAERQAIMTSLKKGMADSDGKMAKCFNPRHAIKTSENQKIVVYVICFECYQLKINTDGSSKTKPTTRTPQSVLNKHLLDANVPLAPGMAGADE